MSSNTRTFNRTWNAALVGVSLSLMVAGYHPLAEARQPDAQKQAAPSITQGKFRKIAQLAAAIQSGNVEAVRSLITADRSLVNQAMDPVLRIPKERAHVTPLMFASVQIKSSSIAADAMLAMTGTMKASDVIPVDVVDANMAIGELLIERGAKVDARDASGMSVLAIAVMKREEMFAGLLLKHDAKVNLRDNEGKTPLTYAVNNNDMGCVGLLLKHGADQNLKDNLGKSPRDYAVEGKYYFIQVQLGIPDGKPKPAYRKKPQPAAEQ